MDECCKLFASCLENQRCVKKFTVIYLQAVRVPLLPSRQKISQKSKNLSKIRKSQKSLQKIVLLGGGECLSFQLIVNLPNLYCPLQRWSPTDIRHYCGWGTKWTQVYRTV